MLKERSLEAASTLFEDSMVILVSRRKTDNAEMHDAIPHVSFFGDETNVFDVHRRVLVFHSRVFPSRS